MLRDLGTTPPWPSGATSGWMVEDVADLGGGRFVLLERLTGVSNDSLTREGVYRWGQWDEKLEHAALNANSSGPAAPPWRLTQDGRYAWNAPAIRPAQPFIPGGLAEPVGLAIPDGVGELRAFSPAIDGAPGGGVVLLGESVQDGRPNSWATVQAYCLMRYEANYGGHGHSLVPAHLALVVNGAFYSIPDCQPFVTHLAGSDEVLPLWQLNGGRWARTTWTAPAGTVTFWPVGMEVAIGSRYIVVVVNRNNGTNRSSTIVAIDRTTGQHKTIDDPATVSAGPLVRGSKAVFYGSLPSSKAGTHTRFTVDLATMKVTAGQVFQGECSGRSTPSYFTDVPRTIGPDFNPYLLMDQSKLKVAYPHISFSGNSLLLRPYVTYSRQADAAPGDVQLVLWSPDYNLGLGALRSEGHFS